ncbi:MAG: methyltransferase [Bacteroidota bacterium]
MPRNADFLKIITDKSKKNGREMITGQLMEMFGAFRKSRLLLTAYELDIFTRLEESPKSSKDTAASTGADVRATDRLMSALAALGFIKKENGIYSNTEISSTYLVKGKPDYLGGIGHMAHLWDNWSGLTKSVITGKPPRREEIGERGEEWIRSFIKAMHSRGIKRSKELKQFIKMNNNDRVLDIGGGSGVFAETLIEDFPKASADIYDLPEVIPVTEEYINKSSASDRMKTVAGDFMRDSLGNGYDMALLSSIIHMLSYEENVLLLKKSYMALVEGGRVVISDYIMSEDRTEPADGAIFALNMLVGTKNGDTYTKREVLAMLEEAGFVKVEFTPVNESTTIAVGYKD